jgi:hypothetical protein
MREVKKLVSDPAMSLPVPDKREFCALHGWVGRRAFKQERHDLCEPLTEACDLGEADHVEGDAENDEAEKISGNRASARRLGIPSKKTLAVRRITQVELAAGRAELQALGGNEPYPRPKTRGDCQWCHVCQLARDGENEVSGDVLECGHIIAEILFRSRPCVFAACKYSLFLDVSETGSIILNFPHLEPGQMPAERSCALDLSERGAMTLEEVAVVTNLTRERIRQVELKALIRRARPAAIAMGLGSEDAAAIGGSHRVGPSADLEETGVEGAVPSDVSTILTGNGWDS